MLRCERAPLLVGRGKLLRVEEATLIARAEAPPAALPMPHSLAQGAPVTDGGANFCTSIPYSKSPNGSRSVLRHLSEFATSGVALEFIFLLSK